jgi:hypothetical protein
MDSVTDHDSEFESQKNFSPRLGIAWAITPKTILRSHFGAFFDQFRLGTGVADPGFGGADQASCAVSCTSREVLRLAEVLSPASPERLVCRGPCISKVLTDAQIMAGAVTCPPGGGTDRRC